MITTNQSNKTKPSIEFLVKELNKKTHEAKDLQVKLMHLLNKLPSVQTKMEFDALVDDIMDNKAQVKKLLGDDVMDLDEQLKDTLDTAIRNHSNLSFFSPLIHIEKTISQSILSAKERISLIELEKSLPEGLATTCKAVITKIKALATLAQLLKLKSDGYKQDLHQADSFETINDIEHEISNLSDQLSSFLNEYINYPEDEQAAGALINYLNTNPHIRRILQSFDFHEALNDDILAARTTYAMSQKF